MLAVSTYMYVYKNIIFICMMGILQDFLTQNDSEEDEDDGMIEIVKGFSLHKDIHSNLYTYQIEGVLWFWKLFVTKKGGILGDDMG